MAHGEEFSNQLLVKLEGTPVPDDVMPLLVNGCVDDSSRVPDLFVLRFTDPAGVVLTKAGFEIGKQVELSLQSTAPGGPEPLLVGEVTALEVEVSEAGVHTVVRGLDLAHRLYRGTRVHAYLNMTASDIVKQVAERAGIECEVDTTSALLDHTTQAAENDWDFLERLAADHDRILTVSAGKLRFMKRPEAGEAPGGTEARDEPLVLEQGVNLVNLRATVTAAGQVPGVQVRGWDPERKEAVVADEPAATLSATTDAGITPESLAQKVKSPTYVAGLATISDPEVAKSAARSLSDHLAGGFAELEGTARGHPALRAGTAVKLVGVCDPFAGGYVLTSTRHDFSPQYGYRTTFVASNASERSLYGSTTAGIDSTAVRGVVPAVVTSAQDPDGLGRVKVTFPWLSDDYESGWARTLQAGAGGDRGFGVLPEVGDEVLVAFEQGDLGHPYVLGGLYNGKDRPKDGQDHVHSGDGSVVRRSWVSRTGMAVAFLEASGDEQLVVSTNDGAQKVVLKQTEKGIDIASEGPVSVTAKQDVEVRTDAGDISMKAVNVQIEAASKLDLKGATVKIAGSATAELSGGATTTVKGGVVRIN